MGKANLKSVFLQRLKAPEFSLCEYLSSTPIGSQLNKKRMSQPSTPITGHRSYSINIATPGKKINYSGKDSNCLGGVLSQTMTLEKAEKVKKGKKKGRLNIVEPGLDPADKPKIEVYIPSSLQSNPRFAQQQKDETRRLGKQQRRYGAFYAKGKHDVESIVMADQLSQGTRQSFGFQASKKSRPNSGRRPNSGSKSSQDQVGSRCGSQTARTEGEKEVLLSQQSKRTEYMNSRATIGSKESNINTKQTIGSKATLGSKNSVSTLAVSFGQGGGANGKHNNGKSRQNSRGQARQASRGQPR